MIYSGYRYCFFFFFLIYEYIYAYICNNNKLWDIVGFFKIIIGVIC